MESRLWKLYDLIKENSMIGKKTTQKEICDKISDFVYKERKGTTDKCSAIWDAIDEINSSPELDKIILTKKYEYWIGNQQETEEYLTKYWLSICPALKRYWNMVNKVRNNGKYKLLTNKLDPLDENSKARAYVESFIERASEPNLEELGINELKIYLNSIGGVGYNGWSKADYIKEIELVKRLKGE